MIGFPWWDFEQGFSLVENQLLYKEIIKTVDVNRRKKKKKDETIIFFDLTVTRLKEQQIWTVNIMDDDSQNQSKEASMAANNESSATESEKVTNTFLDISESEQGVKVFSPRSEQGASSLVWVSSSLFSSHLKLIKVSVTDLPTLTHSEWHSSNCPFRKQASEWERVEWENCPQFHPALHMSSFTKIRKELPHFQVSFNCPIWGWHVCSVNLYSNHWAELSLISKSVTLNLFWC